MDKQTEFTKKSIEFLNSIFDEFNEIQNKDKMLNNNLSNEEMFFYSYLKVYVFSKTFGKNVEIYKDAYKDDEKMLEFIKMIEDLADSALNEMTKRTTILFDKDTIFEV